MKYVVFLIASLLATSATAKTEIKLLTEELVFKEPIAYPRTPNFSISIHSTNFLDKNVEYLAGSLGKNFPILTLCLNDYTKIQFGVEAGTWIVLGYDRGMFPLMLQDFLFAFPVAFRYKNTSLALKYNHISAHQGDGFNRMIDKLHSPPVKPIVYSRDYISVSIAQEFRAGDFQIKPYAQAGYANKMFPKQLGRAFAGGGLEIQYDDLYFAQDVTWNGDVKSWDFSGQVGKYISRSDENLFDIRFAINFYHGSNRYGQLFSQKLDEFGFGFYFQ